MKAVLILVVLVAAGGAIYFLMQQPQQQQPQANGEVKPAVTLENLNAAVGVAHAIQQAALQNNQLSFQILPN